MENNELMHYGVLGMKWGTRRAQKRLGKIDKKSKKQNWSNDATSTAKLRTKKMNQMSNAELRQFNERVRLENEYKNLTRSNKSAGEKFISEVLRETAKDTVKSYTTKYAKKGVEWVIENSKK